jgi:hypothetical protein
MKIVHWTSKDLEILPEDDGTRYEVKEFFYDITRKLPGPSQNQ